MKIILIVIYFGKSISFAEFDNATACQSAAGWIKEKMMAANSSYVVTRCTPSHLSDRP